MYVYSRDNIYVLYRGVAKGGQGGAVAPPPNHSTIHFRKCSNLDKTLIGGGGGGAR